VRGPQDAYTRLVVYGQHACPDTGQADRALLCVVASEREKLRLACRLFPLSRIHPHAEHTAQAAEAAAAHGRCWELHDALSAHQHAVEGVDLRDYAQNLGLDRKWLIQQVCISTCVDRIQKDLRSGLASGVRRTPALYCNEQMHARGFRDATLQTVIGQMVSNASAAPTRGPSAASALRLGAARPGWMVPGPGWWLE